MKDLHHKTQPENETSLVEQAMNAKPEFATREEAIQFYQAKLEDLTTKTRRTLKEMLAQFETSSEPDENAEEAVRLFRTISRLNREHNG